MTQRLEIFDAYGNLRTDFSQAEIEGLDESKVARFHTLVIAGEEAAAADAAWRKNADDIRAEEKQRDKLMAARDAEHKASTFHDEWKRTVANK